MPINPTTTPHGSGHVPESGVDNPPRSRFADRDGVTDAEREAPPGERPALIDLERSETPHRPDQLALFTFVPDGSIAPTSYTQDDLTPESTLDRARASYRLHLEKGMRPRNTIEAYCYDLQILKKLVGAKRLITIDRRDIARFLADTNNKTTRKRRLTSARRFFRYLIDDMRILRFDPTEGYFPHAIQLRTPIPLSISEQEALLAAAAQDEPWSAASVWIMMRLGLTRSELLALKRDQVDRTSIATPIVHVVYEDLARQSKERQLAGDEILSDLLTAYINRRDPAPLLFPVGPPAVNGMVGRVARAAGIEHDVTPQTLRNTFAVEQARAGADQQALLNMLGLANDARNRASVDRYIKLAAAPLAPLTVPLPPQDHH